MRSAASPAALVDLHEKGLIEKLLDTQCFDGQAAASLARNPNHVEISTNVYANPGSKAASCDQLDVVILSARRSTSSSTSTSSQDPTA